MATVIVITFIVVVLGIVKSAETQRAKHNDSRQGARQSISPTAASRRKPHKSTSAGSLEPSQNAAPSRRESPRNITLNKPKYLQTTTATSHPKPPQSAVANTPESPNATVESVIEPPKSTISNTPVAAPKSTIPSTPVTPPQPEIRHEEQETLANNFSIISIGNSSDASAQGSPIRAPSPTRRPHQPTEPARPQITRTLPVESWSRFARRGKQLANKTHGKTPHIPFMKYWPTYDSMTRSQQAWYFYWRSQLRQGIYLKTDLSYVYVHAYEIIHVIGFQNPLYAFNYLKSFWRKARVQHPQIDGYFGQWLLDMIGYYELDVDPLHEALTLHKAGMHQANPDLELAVHLHQDPDWVPTLDFIAKHMRYVWHRSKFYERLDDPGRVSDFMQSALDHLDQYLRSARGKSLVEFITQPGTTRYTRRAFQGAVFDFEEKDIALFDVRYLHINPSEHTLIVSTLKFAENIVRNALGARGQRRGIGLHPEIQRYLENRLAFETPSEQVAEPKPQKFTLNIDKARIKQIAQSSARTRDLLIDEDSYNEFVLPSPSAQPVAEKASEVPSPANPWEHFVQQLQPHHLNALAVICEDPPQYEDFARKNHLLPAMVLEEINALALESIGDSLLNPTPGSPEIYDEHREPLIAQLSYHQNRKGAHNDHS